MGLFSKKAEDTVQYEQVQPQIAPMSSAPANIYPDMMPGGRPEDNQYREAAQFLISNEQLIDQLKAYFRGEVIEEVYDEKIGQVKKETKPVGEPLMNAIGIQRLIGYLEIMLARNSVMSNLSEDFINNLMIEENEVISKHVIVNKQAYAIKDKDVEIIIDEIEDVMYFCLRRAHERGEATLILKGRRESIVRNIDEAARENVMRQGRPIIGWSAR